MSYHPRIETADYATLQTSRTRNSELWFVNNPTLENAILGYLAKSAERYKVKVYAFGLEGNHYHCVSLFPEENRADFSRDFNADITRSVKRHVDEYPGGSLWARRYSHEFLGGDEDIEGRFFYVVLQPVQDGLVEDIKDYPGYNCFEDAIYGRVMTVVVVDWARYNAAKRYNQKLLPDRYKKIYQFQFTRLPGYEHLRQEEYVAIMKKKYEERRRAVLAKRHAEEKTAVVGREDLLKVVPGTIPQTTKKAKTRQTSRPRVQCICPLRHAKMTKWYLSTITDYDNASLKYRQGELTVVFPHGMYKPYCRYTPSSSETTPSPPAVG